MQHVYLKNEIKNEMQEGREREREKKLRKRLMSKKQREREKTEGDSYVCSVKKPGQTKIKLVSNANQTEQANDRHEEEQESKR